MKKTKDKIKKQRQGDEKQEKCKAYKGGERWGSVFRQRSDGGFGTDPYT